MKSCASFISYESSVGKHTSSLKSNGAILLEAIVIPVLVSQCRRRWWRLHAASYGVTYWWLWPLD